MNLKQKVAKALADYDADPTPEKWLIVKQLKRELTGNPDWPIINQDLSEAELHVGSPDECMHGAPIGECNACNEW